MYLRGEDAEQAAVVEWCRARGLFVWHTANESKAPPQWRAKLRILGLLPGVSDLLVVSGPPIMLTAVELKAEGGRPTREQLAFIHRIRECGGQGRVCVGRDEAIAYLTEVLR